MQCLVLAGGLATRLRPLTETLPKYLLPVNGVPFARLHLESLKRAGVTEVLLCVGRLGKQIEEWIPTGAPAGLRVRCIQEGSQPRGTGGALRLAAQQAEASFLVTYGDSFLPVDFRPFQQVFGQSGQPGAMAVFRNQGQWDASNVVLEGGRVALYDKSRSRRPVEQYQAIDYGLLAFDRDAFLADTQNRGERWDLADLLQSWSEAGRLAAWEAPSRFYEVGSPAGYAEFQRTFPARLVVLDRDGTLNATVPRTGEAKPDSPLRPEEVRVLPEVARQLFRLQEAGYGLVIATNQPAAAKGKTTQEALEQVQAEVIRQCETQGARILASFICWHRQEDGCACRKPRPGLLDQAFARYFTALREESWVIGDRETDVQAAQALGIRGILAPEGGLAAAVDQILGERF